jgi:hypothetical protein
MAIVVITNTTINRNMEIRSPRTINRTKEKIAMNKIIVRLEAILALGNNPTFAMLV